MKRTIEILLSVIDLELKSWDLMVQVNKIIRKRRQKTISKKRKLIKKRDSRKALVDTFKYTPYISDSLFIKLAGRLKLNPKELKQAHCLLKHNGDYLASQHEEGNEI